MRISDWSSDVCSSDLLSEWSPKPDAEYTVPFYARQAVELLDQLKLQSVRWVGTSMGGLVGMVAAATALTGRISRSGEHTSELQSLMRTSYASFCLNKYGHLLQETLNLFLVVGTASTDR